MRNVKIFAIIFILLFVASFSMAQGVAINTDGATADGSAMLDVKSTSSGMLIPRMTLAQRNSLTLPAHSLLIYQTDNTPGYYYNSGTPASPVWVRLATGSTVDGSGVATRVAFWTGTTTLGSNANLYWDNTNGRLGVGTTSPNNAKLQIEGSGTYDGVLRLRNTEASAANVFFVASNSAWTFGTNKLGIGLGDPSSTNVKLTIQANGNVGIGSTTPSAKLHVNGTVRFEDYPSGVNGAIVRTDASGNLAITNFTGSASNILLGNNTFGSVADAGGVVSSCGTANYVPKMTSSTAMSCSQIYDNGTNVGIGTTSPAYRLDLAGGTFGFGGSNQRTENRDNAGLQGNAGAQSGFFETSTATAGENWPTGASSYWHLIDCRHTNTANNYAMQFAGSFYDQKLYFRKTNNNAAQPWSEILTTSSMNQHVYTATSASEVRLVSNNTGSYSASAGVGYTPGTFQDVPNTSVTATISSGNAVVVTFSARCEIDTYNYYASEMIWFRILRDGTEIGRTAVFMDGGVDGNGYFYFVDANVALEVYDSGATAGSHTWKVQYWMTDNLPNKTESFFIGERYTVVKEIKI